MSPSFLSTTFLTLSLLSGSVFSAIGPVADLVISSSTVAPDGFSRAAIQAGGTVIGVPIAGKKGDNFRLNVINTLNDSTMLQSTSIHWHGLFQKGTNWADGPAFVSQCPIAKGHSFLYNFNVPDQAGTYWYHSHLSTQYCDGLRGPLVIYDRNDPYAPLYDVDDDSTIITLADWYHTPAKQLLFPSPDSTLINGLGRFSGGNATALSVISVTRGKRYRMRLVNVACDPNYVFSIDNHTMTIIEVDGVNHEKSEVDSIQIFAAQRFSFILNANQTVGNYWIRANPNTGTTGFAGGINSAILRYVGASNEEPTTPLVASVNPMVQSNLVPLRNPQAPGTPGLGNADVNLNLEFAFTSNLVFTVNGVSFVPPTVPVLLQILSGAQRADTLLPTGSVYPLPARKVVELSLPGGIVGGGHPFHLHGHTFSVIRSAGSDVYNYVNPPQRDVVNIGVAGDNVTIRFETDNAGPWFLHCHIDWHLQAGLAIVFAEDVPDWNTSIPVPASWDNLCPIYDALDPSDL